LVNLDRYQIITKISIDNRISSPFPAYTLPLPENTTINRQAAIESSQNIYNLTAEQSIQQIKDLKPVGPPPPPMIDPNQPPPPVDIGKTYQGRVANVMNYGVFVEVVPGRQGLLHTSKMTKEFLKTFSTLKAGDTIPVTVFQVDDQNRVNLSMKDEGKAIVPPGTTSKPIIPFRQTPRPIKPSESRLTRPFKDLPKAVMPDLIRHLPSETVPPGTASLPAGMVTRKADRSSWDGGPASGGGLLPGGTTPDTTTLESIRKEGFRPTVVACIVKNKQILMGYQKIHDLWQLPQSGIEVGRSLPEAIAGKLSAEVGSALPTPEPLPVISQDRIEFPPEKHTSDLKGKHYYFVLLKFDDLPLNQSASEYDQFAWCSFDEALKHTKATTAGGKLRITTKILHLLKDVGTIS